MDRDFRHVLSSVSANTHTESWKLSHADFSGRSTPPWSVTMLTLHGGSQEGVTVIEVDNGALRFTVVPTRGMGLQRVTAGNLTLGWDSPVKQIVHPRHIDLQDQHGKGWLVGFNECMVRCGVAFAGHPGEDQGHLLTLHGRIANIPASLVEVIVDQAPPHRIRVRGLVEERMFKFGAFELWTEITTVPGSSSLSIDDRLINRSAYAKEYQLIYHANFGPPLLEAGSRFEAPIDTLFPFYPGQDLDNYAIYRGPTPGFGEEAYCLTMHRDPEGFATTMLCNAMRSLGVAVRYETSTLPYFTLWKNTDTLEDGYVTGLEPCTSFPYNRRVERHFGRVPSIEPGGERRFQLEIAPLGSASAVEETRVMIDRLRTGRAPMIQREAPKLPVV
jgi:hypothetical protein